MNLACKAVLHFALGLGAFAAADVAGAEFEEIVVVAHKMEREIRDVAANITVLSQEQLRLELSTSISDALRYTPGIDVEGGGLRFGSESINVRGIGGNRVAMLLDGVPISDQFDVGSFSNATRDLVNTGFIDRAEILHGAASALYGSAAIGGVVAMYSPDPATMAAGAAGGELATVWRTADSSRHLKAMQAISGDRFGFLAGISVRNGGEFDSAAAEDSLDDRQYRRRSAILKIRREIGAGDELIFGYYRQMSDVTSDLESVLGGGRYRSTTTLAGDDAVRFDLGVLEYGFARASGWLDGGVLRAYYSHSDVEQFTLDERALAERPVSIERLFAFDQSVRGVELNLHRQISHAAATHDIGFGIEYRWRRTTEYRDALETGIEDGLQTKVLLGEAFPLRDFPVSESRDLGVFVEDSMSIGDVTLIAGLRADRYELDPQDDPLYAEDYPFAEPVAVGVEEISPKLGLVYRPVPSLDVYVQYAHGFRAPPYEDANIGLELPLFNIRAIPNPGLRSERSDGVEVGTRWRGDRSAMRLSLFRTRYDDFIESKVRLGEDPASGRILFQSRNLSAALIEGVEAGWSMRAERGTGTLLLDASLYWARGENRDNGEPLNSVGPPQAIVGVEWLSPAERWRVRLKATFTDGWREADESRGPLFQPPGHAVFDLYATTRVGERLTLRAGVTNLTDRTYWSWSDVRGLAPGDPVLPYLARPGTSLVLGAELSW